MYKQLVDDRAGVSHQVMRQGAYIRSFAACNVKVDVLGIFRISSQVKLGHPDRSGSALYNYALPSALIKPLALDSQGRKHWRDLLQIPNEVCLCFLLKLLQGQVIPRQSFCDLTISIVGVCSLSDLHRTCKCSIREGGCFFVGFWCCNKMQSITAELMQRWSEQVSASFTGQIIV